MICQFCNTQIQDDSKYCTSCGKEVSNSVQDGTVQSQQVAQDDVRRIRCLNGHYFDAAIYEKCPHCGAGVEISDPVFSADLTKKSSSIKGIKERFKKPSWGLRKNNAHEQSVGEEVSRKGAGQSPYNQVKHTVLMMDPDKDETISEMPAQIARKAVNQYNGEQDAVADLTGVVPAVVKKKDFPSDVVDSTPNDESPENSATSSSTSTSESEKRIIPSKLLCFIAI